PYTTLFRSYASVHNSVLGGILYGRNTALCGCPHQRVVASPPLECLKLLGGRLPYPLLGVAFLTTNYLEKWSTWIRFQIPIRHRDHQLHDLIDGHHRANFRWGCHHPQDAPGRLVTVVQDI